MAARAVALACALTLLVSGGSVAASADAKSSSTGATDSPGDSDMAAARTQAVQQGKRVEVTNKHTEDSTTRVNRTVS